MTVRELIEKLNDLPPETVVMADGWTEPTPITTVVYDEKAQWVVLEMED